MKQENFHHKLDLESRVVSKCPSCESKNLELLQTTHTDNYEIGSSIDCIVRCNNCREILEISQYCHVLKYISKEKAQEFKGAKA